MLYRFWPIKLCTLLHIIQFAPFLGWGERVGWEGWGGENSLLSFLVMNEFKILFKSRRRLHFYVYHHQLTLAEVTFYWKLKCPCVSFSGSGWQILIWFIWKLAGKAPILKFFFAQLWNNGLDLSIHNTVRLGWVNVNMQSTCCSEARPNRKLKILII